MASYVSIYCDQEFIVICISLPINGGNGGNGPTTWKKLTILGVDLFNFLSLKH